MAAASKTPTAAGAEGSSSERLVAITTSSPAAGERPKSKQSRASQNETARTSHESTVQANAMSPTRALRSATTPSSVLRTAASTRRGERNGSRPRGRSRKRMGRSP
jgi:hypothetical protein